MKIVVDNQIAKILSHDAAKIVKNPLIAHPENYISFGWPSLLEYLQLGSIFVNLPVFDQATSIFEVTVSTLCENQEKEDVFYIYDSLFAENLNHIKSLPQINASFLLQSIQEQRQQSSFKEVEKALSPSLAAYEVALREKTSHTMHDLILYLAWDRMCVWMARLFDYQSTHPQFIKGLEILKECLIESYQHIAQQGRTSPGIYRMLESFVFYAMREENLQNHTEIEWKVLSQAFQALKAPDEIVDCFYIDEAVILKDRLKAEEENAECYLTLDFPDRVKSRSALAQYMMDKLQSTTPQWGYVLRPKKIVYL